jgi:hypothetical protein
VSRGFVENPLATSAAMEIATYDSISHGEAIARRAGSMDAIALSVTGIGQSALCPPGPDKYWTFRPVSSSVLEGTNPEVRSHLAF